MSGRAVVIGMFLVGIVLGATAFLFAPRVRLRPASPPARAVVAVLPFENRSAEPELELVAASIAGAVVKALETTGRVETVSSETALMFKDVAGGIGRVASELDADYVIAGSVDRSEPKGPVFVDAYLYRAGVEEALWAERLEWASREADRVATDLAARIAASLAER